jgi:hypothetical protein
VWQQVEELNRLHPWSSKKEIPHASYTVYDRHSAASEPATLKRSANGSVVASPRDYLAHPDLWARDKTSAWMNTTELHLVGDQRLPMPEWAAYKYLVHVDGVTASSKLQATMLIGSLVFKEETAFPTYFSRTLRPFVHYIPFWKFRPQDLFDGVAWAQAHDQEAQRIAAAGQEHASLLLQPRGLQCYWLFLLHELAPLLRYDPGEREKERLLKASEYLALAAKWRNAMGNLVVPVPLWRE